MFGWLKGLFAGGRAPVVPSLSGEVSSLTGYKCVVWLHDGSKREYRVEADNHVDATSRCEKLVCEGGVDRGEIKYILAQLP